jgi:DNA-binding transcriptional ArsR family regulator
MLDVEVIADAATAALALDPIRNRLLSELRQPESAASVAGRVGLTRQKANYYLRDLERHGLVATAGERRWGGLTERLFVATARSYVVSPNAMGGLSVDPAAGRDRLSASYAVALAARIVREVGTLWRDARQAGKRLATLSIDTEITFRSPAERAAFSRELGEAITGLAARYHDGSAPDGRRHRVVVVAHPLPEPDGKEDAPCP